MISYSFDIFAIGAAASAIGILGFTVFSSRTRSITARTFFAFSLITIAWSVANYFQYNPAWPFVGIWVVRAIVFLGCWHAFAFFQLCYVFPDERVVLPWWHVRVVLPVVALTSVITLTPLVFNRAIEVSDLGVITKIANGPAIVIFGPIVLALIIAGSYFLVRRTLRSEGIERLQGAYMSIGALITFVCIIIFNIVLPAAFNDPHYIPFTAVYLSPLIGFTAYAILRYHLLNVKAAVTGLLVFLLAAVVFVEVIFSTELYLVFIRIGIFALVLVIGVSLIRSTQKEIELREEVEELSAQKSEFMTFASHEIRNPITAMRGYASLIADGTAGEASAHVQDAAKKILVVGSEVLTLIGEYLNKSKLELGKMSFSMAVFDVGQAVAMVAEGYRPHLDQKGLDLVKDIDPQERIMIKADEGKLKEVVGNLIDNALKYTPHGSITVSVHRYGVHARITIADTGIGIAKGIMPHLFKKFGRADSERVNILGTGIGLYLAKTITEQMGGRVWAESEGRDKGSRFIIEYDLA